MNWRKSVFFIVVVFHLALILCVCIESSIDGYVSFYERKPTALVSTLQGVTGAVCGSEILGRYTTLAGIDAGYGFFAPNVASGYVLEFSSYDSLGTLLGRNRLPDFSHWESYVRYSTLLDAFQDKLSFKDGDKEEQQRITQRQLDAIMKSMSGRMAIGAQEVSTVEVALYLYHFPTLDTFGHGEREPELLIVDQMVVPAR